MVVPEITKIKSIEQFLGYKNTILFCNIKVRMTIVVWNYEKTTIKIEYQRPPIPVSRLVNCIHTKTWNCRSLQVTVARSKNSSSNLNVLSTYQIWILAFMCLPIAENLWSQSTSIVFKLDGPSKQMSEDTIATKCKHELHTQLHHSTLNKTRCSIWERWRICAMFNLKIRRSLAM